MPDVETHLPTKHELWQAEIIKIAAALTTDSNLLVAELETDDLKWLVSYAMRLRSVFDEMRDY